ncbi:MAG: DNA methyltransferase [Candidatus Thermoplasmatota archaeon]|nr:DNA methyltransferase [Candidatus Thermoplasmatota archaeon]
MKYIVETTRLEEKREVEILPRRRADWKEKNIETFGVDLSFSDVPEWRRTKHVHRLHPYLGKFIPQLVEVFLRKYFEKGQTILDPFAGSGTTLIEASVLGLNSIGIGLSEFGHLISKVKIQKYDIQLLEREIIDILDKTKIYSRMYRRSQKTLSGDLPKIEVNNEYFNTWYSKRAAQEIFFYKSQIGNYKYQDVLKVILSRAARSARAIPHYDLARPKKPVKEEYWCIKHKQYCYPVGEALKFINRYSWDTIKRIKEFDSIRTNSKVTLLRGDARTKELDTTEIDGVFTSPPYLGLIDYHEQHRYAYELFNFKKHPEEEIGILTSDEKIKGREKYKQDIISVFKNVSHYLKAGAKIFIVVNDKYNLYPKIGEECDFSLVDIFRRPVLCRTERNEDLFSESIYYFENK